MRRITEMKMIRILLCFVLVCFGSFVSAQDFEKGRVAFDAGDYQTAVKYWQVAAMNGDKYAQGMLGVLYKNGMGVERDYKEAFRWFLLSTQRDSDEYYSGDTISQYHLGTMYEEGLGVDKDFTEAEKWYRLSAENYHTDAQVALGKLYLPGNGVPQNLGLSYMWFSIAASFGHEIAGKMVEIFEDNWTASQVTMARSLVQECKKMKYKNCY